MSLCGDQEMLDPDLKLPEQFTFTSIRALRMTSRRKIAQFLNLEGNMIVCETDTGTGGYGHGGDNEIDLVNNYNGLAELIQFDYLEIQNLMRQRSPTEELLEQWTSARDGGRKASATVGNLWRFLYMMERFDVLKDCRRTICNDCRIFEEHRAIEEESHRYNIEQDPTVSSNTEMLVDEEKFVDKDSVLSGQSVHYNAFISWSGEDDDDHKFVRFLIEELEVNRGLKLFVPGRDDLPGSAYHTITAYLIEKKCDRVVLLLSRSFLQSPACDFQLKFAHALAPGARSKKLIPVLRIRNTHIPRILKFLAVCDFSKTDMRDWVIDRLYSAIIAPIGPETFYDEFDAEEQGLDERLQARRELESSIYPSTHNAFAAHSSSTSDEYNMAGASRYSSSQSQYTGGNMSGATGNSQFQSSGGFSSGATGCSQTTGGYSNMSASKYPPHRASMSSKSSGIGSSIAATSLESLSSLSQFSDSASISGGYRDGSLVDTSSMGTVVAESDCEMMQVVPGHSGTGSANGNTSSISRLFPQCPANPPQSQPQPNPAAVKPKKGGAGKAIKKLFGRSKSKKNNGSPKGEKHEDFGSAEVLTEEDEAAANLRKYNPGIVKNQSGSTENLEDPRISTSSEEFVKIDNDPERFDTEGRRGSGGGVTAGCSQSAVQATRQQGRGQDTPLGYRPTNSEVVNKAKPEIPPKPKLDNQQRRPRSPFDDKRGASSEEVYV